MLEISEVFLSKLGVSLLVRCYCLLCRGCILEVLLILSTLCKDDKETEFVDEIWLFWLMRLMLECLGDVIRDSGCFSSSF